MTYSLEKLSVVDLNSEFCMNQIMSLSVPEPIQMPSKKKSCKFMIIFKHKQHTPQLIERVKNKKEICKIYEIYRNCYELWSITTRDYMLLPGTVWPVWLNG